MDPVSFATYLSAWLHTGAQKLCAAEKEEENRRKKTQRRKEGREGRNTSPSPKSTSFEKQMKKNSTEQ